MNKNTDKSIWTLKPVVRCCCHKAIMSLLVFLFCLFVCLFFWWICLQDDEDDDDDVTHKKSVFGLLKMETNNKRKKCMKLNQTTSFFFFVCVGVGRPLGHMKHSNCWTTNRCTQPQVHTHTHTHKHTYGGILNSDHTPRQVWWLFVELGCQKSLPPHLAPSSLPPTHSLLRCH